MRTSDYQQLKSLVIYKAKQHKEKYGYISWKKICKLVENAYPEHGLSYNAIRAIYRRSVDSEYSRTKNIYARRSERRRRGIDTIRKMLLKKLTSKTSLQYLYEQINADMDTILAEISKLEYEGYEVNKWTEDGTKFVQFRKRRYDNHAKVKIDPADEVKFLVISDTHYGHKKSEKEFTKEVIKYAYEKGIRNVLHVGDLTEGHYMSIRPRAIQELEAIGFDDQLELADKSLPKHDGLVYYMISGNHDHTYTRHAFANPVRSLAYRRQDVKYLGYNFGKILIGKIDIALVHPTDGIGQNYGLKLHKYIDRAVGEKQARIVLMGHYHKHTHMHYKNIDGFILPGLVSQSQFMKDNNLASVVGAMILTLKLDKKGDLVSILPEYIWKKHNDTT